MKRVLSCVLILVLAVSLMGIPAYAKTYSDKAIIIVSKKEANIGDTVTVKVSEIDSQNRINLVRPDVTKKR